jgi:hypothetical protein
MDDPVIKLLLAELDPGEAAAIALPRRRNSNLLILDDKAGRRIARRLGLTITGTVGVVLAAAAFERLDQALASKEQWRYFLSEVSPPAQIAAQFAEHFNRLLHRLGRFDRAALHASFLGTSKKTGRNDPCPCGSGKKYKKSCLGRI